MNDLEILNWQSGAEEIFPDIITVAHYDWRYQETVWSVTRWYTNEGRDVILIDVKLYNLADIAILSRPPGNSLYRHDKWSIHGFPDQQFAMQISETQWRNFDPIVFMVQVQL